MADITTIEEDVRSIVGDCPFIVIHRALNRASREFCQRTTVWRIDEKFKIKAGQSRYELPLDRFDLGAIIDLRVDDKQLCAAPDAIFPDQRVANPMWYASEDSRFVELFPAPKEDAIAVVTIAVVPKRNDMQLRDDILSRNSDALARYAAYDLMLQRSKEWYSPNDAMVHKSEFDTAVKRTRKQLNTGHAGATRVASGGYFA